MCHLGGQDERVKLELVPAHAHPELLAPPVFAALPGGDVRVASIDPTLADTAAFCEAYDVGLDVSANCVIVAGTRGELTRYAACMVLATTRLDVNGVVRLKLYKGNVIVTGRKSPYSLYSEKVVTFEDDQGAYDQRDAAGFIKLNALRLRLLGRRDQQG